MGNIRPVYKAALIAGITFAGDDVYEISIDRLTDNFGPIELKSPVFEFTMTDYYTAEMGTGLRKQFIAFTRPIDMEALPGIKHATNAIENDNAVASEGSIKRRINIDPGYVTLSKLVLATTKDYSHRVYIGQSMYAETTLRFVGGTFSAFETTYPDHQTPLAIAFFNEVRDFVRRNRDAWNT